MNASARLFILSSIGTTINYQSFNVIFRARLACHLYFCFDHHSKVKLTLASSFYFHTTRSKTFKWSSERFHLPLKCTYTFFSSQRLNVYWFIVDAAWKKKVVTRVAKPQIEMISRASNASIFLPIKKQRWSTVHSPQICTFTLYPSVSVLGFSEEKL